ncbi:MAG: hypothetical protein ACLTUP_12935 [Anaerotignum sp.]
MKMVVRMPSPSLTEKGCNCITYPFIDPIPFCYEKNRPAMPVCQIS